MNDKIISSDLLQRSGWEMKPLRDVLTIKGRIGWKGYKTSDLRSEGPVVVGGTNIKSLLHMDFSQKSHLSREKYDESPEIMLKEGDVLLVARGNGIGDVGYFSGEFEEATINPSVVILTDFKGDSRFLFYYLISPQGRGEILTQEGGSSIPALYQGLLKSVMCPFPEIKEQQAIAEVLSNLDNKIDLLHRNNRTMEQMAEILFRLWFVEKPEIGSEQGTVSDLFTLQRGYDLPTQDRVLGMYPIVTSSGVGGFHETFKVRGPGVSTGRSGVLGKVFYLPGDFWPLNTSLYVSAFKRGTPLFTYFFLKTLDLGSLNAGSAVPTLNRNHVHSLPVFLPSSQLISTFENIARPLFDKIQNNAAQIKTIDMIRNLLIPKLMNGEVRVDLKVKSIA